MINDFLHKKQRALADLYEVADPNARGIIHNQLSEQKIPNGRGTVPLTEDLTKQDAKNGYEYYLNAVRNNIAQAEAKENNVFNYIKKQGISKKGKNK